MFRIIERKTDNRTVLVEATPGGGKSCIPVIAGAELIGTKLADRICWIVPRNALKDQGERAFMDPFFREMFRHRLHVRSSTNEINPSRDSYGFITTYQAVGLDTGLLLDEFSRRRYVAVLDEFHHVEECGNWHKKLQPIIDKAAYTVLMTGTLQRGNGKKIAFVPYRLTAGGWDVDRHSLAGQGVEYIRYSRSDALAEKAILPLVFHLHDGSAKYENEDRDIVEVPSLAGVAKKDAGAAIYTALATEFAIELLDNALEHWIEHRKKNPRSKLLVVAAGIDSAKRYIAYLKNLGIKSNIATSHNSSAAQQVILDYKRGRYDAIVTIAMAYEGLDVPEITHIVALTHIRSVPWIEQMVARAVRIDRQAGPYESQFGWIFAPDDTLFRRVVDQIKAEQSGTAESTGEDVAEKERKKGGPEQLGLFGSGNSFGIKPLESQITDARQFHFGTDISNMSSMSAPVFEKTPTEKAMDLRREIDSHVRRFEFVNHYKYGKINTELKKRFQSPRADMTLSQLTEVWDFVQVAYPIVRPKDYKPIKGVSKPRGRGRREPIKAVPYTGPVTVPTY